MPDLINDIKVNGNLPQDVLQLKCEPLEVVRMAFVGLGKRGTQAFGNFMYIDGIEVVALADLCDANIKNAIKILENHSKKPVAVYTEPEDWKRICERPDVDLIYVCTDRILHTPIAVYAMQCGKHVAVEVPAANTLDECWQLVDTAESTRRHCIMLENCCYDWDELVFLNMKQQGLFGEIFHAEGGYIHSLRHLDFESKKHYLDMWNMHGNPYPTHGLGPVCQMLDIHRGDRLKSLVSVSGGQFSFPPVSKNRESFVLGNINTSIITTHKNKTIVLQHDISSPRPYSRNYLVSGTKGFVQKRYGIKLAFEPDTENFLSENETDELMRKYEHPFYKEKGDLAREVGTHGGMNFIMDYRLIYCLRNGLPLDMDVYDAAEWSSVIGLTEQSVLADSLSVEIPDFTRGRWNVLNGLQIHY